MSFDFTYESYGQLLTTIGARFEIIPASKLNTVDAQAWCLMRHDIDNDLGLALPIAEIEKQLGISSTYYLMTASSLYNIHESDTRKDVAALVALGHEIGLHHSTRTYNPSTVGEVVDAISREVELFKWLFDIDVKSVSFHQPYQSVRNGDQGLNSFDFSLADRGLTNSYSSADMRNSRYVSDSLMNFDEGDPIEWFRETEHGQIQLLTHPSWYDSTSGTAEDRWDRVLVSRFDAQLERKIADERSMNAPREVLLRRL
jgi:hypothetical protein